MVDWWCIVIIKWWLCLFYWLWLIVVVVIDVGVVWWKEMLGLRVECGVGVVSEMDGGGWWECLCVLIVCSVDWGGNGV